MFPLILISKNKDLVETFITSYIAENAFQSYAVTRIEPLKTELAISQIRELKRDLLIKQKEVHLVILTSFDTASLEAQNAFLKTLEEENERFQFVMTASSEEMILPTVRSRSKVIHLQKETEIKITIEYEEFINSIISGESYSFLGSPLVSGLDAGEVASFFDQTIFFFKHRLETDRYASKIIKKILEIKYLLERNNLNPQLAIDTILIFIHKQYKLGT